MIFNVSRRAVLRGAGVALALPWLESLAPRSLQAQAPLLPRRFLPIFLPNGAPEFWRPRSSGSGDEWGPSSLLESFAASLKSKLNVLSNLENASAFLSDGNHVEPSHSRLCGAWLTCVDAQQVRARLGLAEANGISVDQVLAQHESFKGKTPLDSLQLGLSTPASSCETEPCSSSRSVSWANATQPLYKLVNPLEVFNQIAGAAAQANPSPEVAIEAQKRLARNTSVLDAVLENAQRTRARLGGGDRRRMDEFLDSVRAVEQRALGVSKGMALAGCDLTPPDDLSGLDTASAPRQTTESYDKGRHADIMNELIRMAFECDVTRVVSHMLEDERSEFTYDNVVQRSFTPDSDSSQETGSSATCPEYHTSQHSYADAFATITWWNVGKVAELCQSLDAIEEAPGVSILDNTVVFLGAGMHSSDHNGDQLPALLVGGGNLGLKTDQHLVLDNRPLRDLYFTLMNDVYALGVTDFGENLKGAPPTRISELLKG
jgi:hypothetical protein